MKARMNTGHVWTLQSTSMMGSPVHWKSWKCARCGIGFESDGYEHPDECQHMIACDRYITHEVMES